MEPRLYTYVGTKEMGNNTLFFKYINGTPKDIFSLPQYHSKDDVYFENKFRNIKKHFDYEQFTYNDMFDNRNYIFALNEHNEIIGMIVFYYVSHNVRGVSIVQVHKQYKNKGILKKMYELLFTYAKMFNWSIQTDNEYTPEGYMYSHHTKINTAKKFGIQLIDRSKNDASLIEPKLYYFDTEKVYDIFQCKDENKLNSIMNKIKENNWHNDIYQKALIKLQMGENVT